MLVNVKTEDFYYSADEIKQLAAEFGLYAALEKTLMNRYGYELYIQDPHFYTGTDSLSERLVMGFTSHAEDKNVFLATQAYPNFCAYNTSRPYEMLYTTTSDDASCYGVKIIPKWTLADTDPFLQKIFDTHHEVLRKSEVKRILNEFLRNVKLHLQRGKNAEIKEAAEQYSV